MNPRLAKGKRHLGVMIGVLRHMQGTETDPMLRAVVSLPPSSPLPAIDLSGGGRTDPPTSDEAGCYRPSDVTGQRTVLQQLSTCVPGGRSQS